MKNKKVLLSVGMAVLSLAIFSGCGTNNTATYEPYTAQEADAPPTPPPAINPAPQFIQEVEPISPQNAGELAVNFVGYGQVYQVSYFEENGNLIFEVDVRDYMNRYRVTIDGEGGYVIGSTRFENYFREDEPEEEAPAIDVVEINISIPDNIIPRPSLRIGGPSDPPVSVRRAAEMARDHLVYQGITTADFNHVVMERDGDVWVWGVVFQGEDREFEFYVDVNTGEILKFQ